MTSNINDTFAVLASACECMGCEACASVCSHDAISISENAHGFLAPSFNAENCNNCGLCKNICPLLNLNFRNTSEPACYAAMAKTSIRKSSSSGGAFRVFAEYIIKKGGYVCGASYDKNFDVEHIIISDTESLAMLQKSKYVQSKIGTVYNDIKFLLSKGKHVLFTGTPCQVAGLYAAIGTEHENLVTVDLLCNNVPSPGVFRSYLSEVHGQKKIISIDFRDKRYRWGGGPIVFKYEDGTINEMMPPRDKYMRGFLSMLFSREACLECPYNTIMRQGDITIGDFWGIERFDHTLNDSIGTSVILVNNKAGADFFELIREEFPTLINTPLDNELIKSVLETNRVKIKIPGHPARERFFDMFARYGFSKSVDHALTGKYDVGIVGFWTAPNVGAHLTGYAMYRTITDRGLEPLMIKGPSSSIEPLPETPRLFRESPYPSYSISPSYKTNEAMRALNSCCDTFISASDQVWQYDLLTNHGNGGIFNLDFTEKQKKRIAYASSFGGRNWWGSISEQQKFAYYLSRYDAISVREQSGVGICSEYFHVDAAWVLDPVFLLDVSVYNDFILKSEIDIPENYLVSHMYKPTLDKTHASEYIANQLEIPKIFKAEAASFVEDWLKIYANSKFIITDSYHGVCFAIIFQKPFIVLENYPLVAERVLSLLRLFNLEHRYISDESDIYTNHDLIDSIDYVNVYKILNGEIIHSLKWLDNALNIPVKNQIDDIDFLEEQISELSLFADTQKGRTDELSLLADAQRGRTDELSLLADTQKRRTDELSLSADAQRERIDALSLSTDTQRGRIDELSLLADEKRGQIDELLLFVYTQKGQIDELSSLADAQRERIDGLSSLVAAQRGRIDELSLVINSVEILQRWMERVRYSIPYRLVRRIRKLTMFFR